MRPAGSVDIFHATQRRQEPSLLLGCSMERATPLKEKKQSRIPFYVVESQDEPAIHREFIVGL
jgi:hypothetical protein